MLMLFKVSFILTIITIVAVLIIIINIFVNWFNITDMFSVADGLRIGSFNN